MENPLHYPGWIDKLKRRGGAPYALMMLDVMEPIGAGIGAGFVGRAAAGRLVEWASGALGELAQLLEAPDGIESLRKHLADEE